VFTHSDSIHIRYVALLNALAALAPTSILKGRANDPLLHASWWTFEQHSAVLVVSLATILGTALVYVLLRQNLRRWWMILLSGSFTGMFPGLFYLAAAPVNNQSLPLDGAMIILGLVWGGMIGIVIHAVAGKSTSAPEPNNRWSGRER
jgi:hypothetical protein